MEGKADWRVSDEHIDDRLRLYERWDSKNSWAQDLEQVEDHMKFGYRCEGVLEALSHRYLNEIEKDDVWRVIIHNERPLKDAYEIFMNAIEENPRQDD